MKLFKQPHIVAPGWDFQLIGSDRIRILSPTVDRGVLWLVWFMVDRLSDNVVEFNTNRHHRT